MGTVGSYTGGGGKDGDDLRESITDWLDHLPSAPPGAGGDEGRRGPAGVAGPEPAAARAVAAAAGPHVRPRPRPARPDARLPAPTHSPLAIPRRWHGSDSTTARCASWATTSRSSARSSTR